MAGHFDLIDSPNGGYRFRLFDSSGRLLAVSATYPTKRDAAAGITVVREIAGTGLIRDMSHGHQGEPIQPRIKSARAEPRHNGAHRFPGTAVHANHPH